MINFFAFISLGCSFITFTLGIFVFNKNPKRELNRDFMLFCLSVSILSFAEFGMRQAETYYIAKMWFILTGIFPLCAFMLFHFTLIFKNPNFRRKKKYSLMIYTSGIIICFISFFIQIFYTHPFKINGSYDYGVPQERFNNPIMLFIFILSISLTLLSIGLYIKVAFSSTDVLQKIQAKFITIGISNAVLPFIIINGIFPLIFPNIAFPDLSTLGVIITCIVIGYAMSKYELFSLDLTTASEKIFSTISDCLILINPQNKILSVNQELLKLLDYRENEIKQKPFVTLLASEPDNKLYQYQYQILTDNNIGELLTDIEVDFKTKTDEKIKMSLIASKITDKNGDLRGIIYIGRNITKMRKIEQQLDEAIQKSQFKSKFLASMSHELRTPLNAIIGFVDLLLEDYCGPLNNCMNDFLSDIKLSSYDLLELINHLLDLSKIEAGELELEIKGINIESLLNHIQIIFKPLCRKKNLDLQIDNLTTSKFFDADFVRIKEILFNLLNNALKFTKKGRILLRVKELVDYFEFEVIDSGIGIAESDYGNIFEEFKKIYNPEIRDSQGVGLGLAITNHLVKLHGGHISFSSEVGKGSIFSFTMPKKKKL